LIKLPDGFDANMSYQLRERNLATLEEMQRDVVSVEANLLAKRARIRTKKRVTIKEEPSTSSADAKIDSLVRTMEMMMDRLDIADRTAPRENQPDPQIINPNFRRNQPQIRQREQRGPYQQIQPPFQENYVDEGEEIVEDLDDVHINLMGINDNDSIFLTQEEQDLFLLSQTEMDHEESKYYKQGFENAIMEVHR
jgi:L-rhamnose mutarotase